MQETVSEKVIKFIDTSLRILFYLIFFLVPIVMFPTTYELFEFNKMWVVFMLTLLILLLWIIKMILRRKIIFTRTPLDIPIGFFLLSQIVSTIFSLDSYVSLWGYYSRFNGGLLSLLSYFVLYYAFASNLLDNNLPTKKKTGYRLILVSLITGFLVALWGLPSHYGYDPTCFIFRGSLDVSCWTDAFQPMVRMFSTLGQPNWLAAYLAALLLVGISLIISYTVPTIQTTVPFQKFKNNKQNQSIKLQKLPVLKVTLVLVASLLFYCDLIYTDSQSGFLGFWAANVILSALVFVLYQIGRKDIRGGDGLSRYLKVFIGINLCIVLITFYLGTPILKLNKYMLPGLKQYISTQQKKTASPSKPSANSPASSPGGALETDITSSGNIRLIVWKGAFEIFKRYPVFGTGVETYAYAYYLVRPKEHNLTTEWDYLYNKAHNEYLNYLATTGLFGFLSYLSLITMFLYTAYKILFNTQNFVFERTIGAGIVGAYISILVSNFFGFSVVILNIFLFFLPILFYDILGVTGSWKQYGALVATSTPAPQKTKPYAFGSERSTGGVSPSQTLLIILIVIPVIYFEFQLVQFWFADLRYALGYNLNRTGSYAEAYQPLTDAVTLRPGEDLFRNELADNLATLALGLAQQNQATEAAQFIQKSEDLIDGVNSRHPNNVIYFKTRTRIYYTLAQINSPESNSLLAKAISAIEKAHALAPTDAKIMYNMGLLYDQAGEIDKAIATLKQTIVMKADYRDAYYALALIDTQQAQSLKKTDPTTADRDNSEAKTLLEYVITHIAKDDKASLELLKSIK